MGSRWQRSDPGYANWPVGHSAHSVAPGVSLYVYQAHAVQSRAMLAEENLPVGHCVHVGVYSAVPAPHPPRRSMAPASTICFRYARSAPDVTDESLLKAHLSVCMPCDTLNRASFHVSCCPTVEYDSLASGSTRTLPRKKQLINFKNK